MGAKSNIEQAKPLAWHVCKHECSPVSFTCGKCGPSELLEQYEIVDVRGRQVRIVTATSPVDALRAYAESSGYSMKAIHQFGHRSRKLATQPEPTPV